MDFNRLQEVMRVMQDIPDLPVFDIEEEESSSDWDSDSSSEISSISSSSDDGCDYNNDVEFHDDGKTEMEELTGTYGCSHYLRRCKLIAPCCGNQYTCRLCHDDVEDHQIDRFTVQQIVCSTCNCIQDIQQYCKECGTCFGLYFCDKCRLFTDILQNQYHCDKCGFCRIAPEDGTTHCDKCDLCIPNLVYDKHPCKENAKEELCPICLGRIHDSVDPVIGLPCNHQLHRDCFLELSKTSFKCPTCSTAMMDLTNFNQIMEDEVSHTPMPDEYKDFKVNILCNQCHKESKVNFHIVGMKCPDCGSYNTRQV